MEQQDLLIRTVEILEKLAIPYMVTGSFAVNFYGIPRTTHDIDLVVQITPADAPRLADEFPHDFYLDRAMIKDAIEQRFMFNVIDPSSGLKIDFWLLKQDAYDMARFQRRRPYTIFGHQIWFPSPEDVILSKWLWYKQAQTDRHLHDARGIWDVQGESLDREYLRHWATELGVQNWLDQLER